jgi:hypothetical protein
VATTVRLKCGRDCSDASGPSWLQNLLAIALGLALSLELGFDLGLFPAFALPSDLPTTRSRLRIRGSALGLTLGWDPLVLITRPRHFHGRLRQVERPYLCVFRPGGCGRHLDIQDPVDQSDLIATRR